ncbi:ATP-binding cassette domain-containing protein [Neolewinella antarctica]|uniref:ABC-type multidrug transport system ATPase subunit n=1 Tax=Neolewinella antarctica TaxID=442734 RepID=A0ABX0XFW8_9BACT|nr:ABC transporter ATP-binding protein [Neolewinella antarctica]NJC27647.1 ABC-type multidrug transport system ATPase subunit [Neolewinella antarctica]
MTLKNIGFRYGTHEVFRGLNLRLEPGTIYGLVGPNGVGKTTLLSIIAGILPGYTGELSEIDRPGLLLQNTSFYENLTGWENLQLICREKGINQREVAKVLHLVDVNDALAAKKFRAYSQGYKQRFGIARSFLSNGNLVLLDEPFTAVDVDTIGLLKAALLKFVSATGKTVVISSHQLREIEEIIDVSLVVNNKCVTEFLATATESATINTLYITLGTTPETDADLSNCPLLNDTKTVGNIVAAHLLPEVSSGQVVDWMETHKISWKRIDKKMPLEYLYATTTK